MKLSEVEWHGVGCYKIEMDNGTVYFEKDNGVSGFKSFIDSEGNDWIASYMEPGPKGEYRGFPNSPGNFGHAGRDSGSTNIVVDDKREGDVVVIESWNHEFRYQYWFLPKHVSLKVIEAKRPFCFLLETVVGGSSEEEDFYVTADGEKHIPQIRKSKFDDFTPEWFYLGDPRVNDRLFLAKTPDDDAPNENHRQFMAKRGVINMDLYSFGRWDKERGYGVEGMTGTEHVCSIGFIDGSKSHEEIKRFIEGIMAKPFEPVY
ncbi:MAG: hypothetical protein F6K21_17600 [Symploca sp. SIO2D2]|nr:hypothetical protein [Symploca sp. SIO2D2]